jgi:hypothetical protein
MTKPIIPSDRISQPLARASKQVQNQVIIYRDATKAHGHRGLFPHPITLTAALAFRRHDIDFANGADELGLPSIEWPGDNRFHGLHHLTHPEARHA